MSIATANRALRSSKVVNVEDLRRLARRRLLDRPQCCKRARLRCHARTYHDSDRIIKDYDGDDPRQSSAF
jgi:hypothetical protein